ncbi:putative protein kinase [Massospora cicadina]|nr:putative protein kinase [Massospora cicadina]
MLYKNRLRGPSRAFQMASVFKTSQGNFQRDVPTANLDNMFYINHVLDSYTDKGLKKLTLRQLIFFGKHITHDKLLASANYVRKELPVRLAHRIRDFQALPFKVGINPHVQATYQLYWDAFHRIKKVSQINTSEDNVAFCQLLEGVLQEHMVVISKLALGMAECSSYLPPNQIDDFMNKALMSRIARRVVAEQHIALTKRFNGQTLDCSDDQVGIISINCDPESAVRRCATMAMDLVGKLYQKVHGKEISGFPELVVDGHKGIRFPFVKDHIDYILFEVLKNSYQATLRQNVRPPRPIRVTIAEGLEEVVIRISDNGGGIPLHQVPTLMSFAKSDPMRQSALQSMPPVSARVATELTAAEVAAILPEGAYEESKLGVSYGRLGIGLPVVSNFMRYWGGSLHLASLAGLGCNVYLRFPNGRVGAREHLPFDPSQPEFSPTVVPLPLCRSA